MDVEGREVCLHREALVRVARRLLVPQVETHLFQTITIERFHLLTQRGVDFTNLLVLCVVQHRSNQRTVQKTQIDLLSLLETSSHDHRRSSAHQLRVLHLRS